MRKIVPWVLPIYSDAAPAPIGFVAAKPWGDHLVARTKSYSSYQGRYDALDTNVFGQPCVAYHSRQLQMWKTKEGATKACHAGETVLELYPDNEELRKRVAFAVGDKATLRALTQMVVANEQVQIEEVVNA